MHHTRHSAIRAQQRNVPSFVIDWLKNHGKAYYTHRGAVILHFTRRIRNRLKDQLGRQEYARIERFLNRYAVVSLDRTTLITVGIRYQHLNH